MNNNLLQIKIKQRLNKLSSLDYDNLECWQIAEAFNKAQIEWVRRQLHGTNNYKEGDENSKRRIDDLQKLLTTINLSGSMVGETFYQADTLPENYLEFKRVSTKGKTNDCPDRTFVVYLAEEADVDILLSDKFSKPSFDWAETFCTMVGNRIRIYTNGEFDVISPRLNYYRKPVEVQFEGCIDLNTGTTVTADVQSEFKDDIIELICDEAASILAGDIESIMQYQRNEKSAERNN
jgi:hypothetical protein